MRKPPEPDDMMDEMREELASLREQLERRTGEANAIAEELIRMKEGHSHGYGWRDLIAVGVLSAIVAFAVAVVSGL
jgi:hypothetical protein